MVDKYISYNIMIYKTHTRRDIINIIETYNIPLKNYEELSKPLLFDEVWKQIQNLKNVKPTDEIDDLKHLKSYLSNVNQNRIKIAERDKYIDIAKHIIFYVKNDCLITYTNYLSEDDLIRDVKTICNYCKLPTCLRAINMLNASGKFKEKFEPIITGKTKVLLRKREQERLSRTNRISIRTKNDNNNKPFIVYFD